MKLFSYFMVSARGMCNTSTNPEMVLQTLKRNISQSLKSVKSRHVFSRLCMMTINTNAVEILILIYCFSTLRFVLIFSHSILCTFL